MVSSLWLVGALLLGAPLDLQGAVRRAVAVDLRLMAAGAEVRAAAASVEIAEGAFDLRLEASLDANTQRQTASFGGPVTRFQTRTLSLDAGLIQPLEWGTQLSASWVTRFTATDNPLRNCVPGQASEQCYETSLRLSMTQALLRNRGRAANTVQIHAAEAEQATQRAARWRRVVAVCEAVVGMYARRQLSLAEVRIREGGLSLAQRQLAATEGRVEAGAQAALDLAVVRQAVAERTQALFLARLEADDAGWSLATQLDMPSAPTLAPVPPPTLPADLTAARLAVRQGNPDLAVAASELERQRRAARTQAEDTRPQLDLTLVAAQIGIDSDLGAALVAVPDNDAHFYGATLALAWPISNRAARAALQRAHLGIRAGTLRRRAQARELSQAGGEAWRAAHTAVERARLAEQVVALAARSLQAEREKFALGRSTDLDLLRVQQDQVEAELSVARARADELTAWARLEALTGRLPAHFGVQAAPPTLAADE